MDQNPSLSSQKRWSNSIQHTRRIWPRVGSMVVTTCAHEPALHVGTACLFLLHTSITTRRNGEYESNGQSVLWSIRFVIGLKTKEADIFATSWEIKWCTAFLKTCATDVVEEQIQTRLRNHRLSNNGTCASQLCWGVATSRRENANSDTLVGSWTIGPTASLQALLARMKLARFGFDSRPRYLQACLYLLSPRISANISAYRRKWTDLHDELVSQTSDSCDKIDHNLEWQLLGVVKCSMSAEVPPTRTHSKIKMLFIGGSSTRCKKDLVT